MVKFTYVQSLGFLISTKFRHGVSLYLYILFSSDSIYNLFINWIESLFVLIIRMNNKITDLNLLEREIKKKY